MNKFTDYAITPVNHMKYSVIVTILNYKTDLINILANITEQFFKEKTILLDCLVISGLNEYRFIEVTFNSIGDISHLEYTVIDNDLLGQADSVLRKRKDVLYTSILSFDQVERFMNGGHK